MAGVTVANSGETFEGQFVDEFTQVYGRSILLKKEVHLMRTEI